MYPYSVDYTDPNVINGVVNSNNDHYSTDPYSADPYSTKTCIGCGQRINSANRTIGYSRYCRNCI